MARSSNKANITKDDIKNITLFASAVGNIFQVFDQADKAKTIEQLKNLLNKTQIDKELISNSYKLLILRYNELVVDANKSKDNIMKLQSNVKQFKDDYEKKLLEKEKEISELKKTKGSK